MEGTFKRGLARILGTLLGGFAAWIGVLLCSWSLHGTSPINPYAFAVWLSAMALIAVRIGLNQGPAALMGPNYDVGFISQFFAMLLSVISLQAYLGVGDIEDLFLNRIVATITGVLAAVLVAFIPPFTHGRDPDLVLDYCVWLTQSLDAIIKKSLAERKPLNLTEFEETYMVKAAKMRRLAKFVLEDAGTLSFVPHFRVPAEIQQMRTKLVVDESIIYQLANRAASDLVWQNDASVEEGGQTNWDQIADALQAIVDGKGRKDATIELVLADLSTPARVSAFVRAASNHRDRLIQSTRILLNLQRGKHRFIPPTFSSKEISATLEHTTVRTDSSDALHERITD